jgi:N-acetylmuramoyl-L-alanine amidase
MFNSPLYTVRLSDYLEPLVPWWRDLAYLWGRLEKGSLTFFSGLGLLATVAGLMVYFSITGHSHLQAGHDRMRAEHARIQAEHTRIQELTCLALNVYHEARGEPLVGQYAVAEVTMNRVVSRRYPDTICDVVYEQRWDRIRRRYVGAFSWTELDSTEELRTKEWSRALKVAEAVYDEREKPMLQGALFYHARTIRPSWARGKQPVARIGAHVFYL